MNKWSLSSSQLLPSKGMEKYQSIDSSYPDDHKIHWGMSLYKKVQVSNENEQQVINKESEESKHLSEMDSEDQEDEEKSDQDYTLDSDLESDDSVIEEINDMACNNPFLSVIKEFCIKNRENEIRKGESWNCKACNFSNYSSRLACFKCKCWKWEKSRFRSNFPTFVPKIQIINLIKKMKKKYGKKQNSGDMALSKGPRYALISSDNWNSVLTKEQAVELSFNAKRQVTRATQFCIRGGKERESLSSALSAKYFKAEPSTNNLDCSNHMGASHSELDSIKSLIREKWWKSDENWLPNEDWTKLSIFDRTMLRFKFSFSHLNVDAFTWNKFSYNEKTEFSRRKKRWMKEHMKSATDSQKKMMNFWRSRFRWKKMIWSIKDQNWKNYINDTF